MGDRFKTESVIGMGQNMHIIKTGAEAPVKGDYPYSAAVNLAAARYLN